MYDVCFRHSTGQSVVSHAPMGFEKFVELMLSASCVTQRLEFPIGVTSASLLVRTRPWWRAFQISCETPLFRTRLGTGLLLRDVDNGPTIGDLTILPKLKSMGATYCSRLLSRILLEGRSGLLSLLLYLSLSLFVVVIPNFNSAIRWGFSVIRPAIVFHHCGCPHWIDRTRK
jgi:hypothetical protein